MDAARYQVVKEKLALALDLDKDARQAFLAALGDDDPPVYQEVMDLLEATDEDDYNDFMEASPPLVLPESVALEPGTILGDFRIVEPLASGGMGQVFLAERHDAAFEQKVAIKVLKKGMESRELLARFRTERQILADLDHRNIARLITGGTTPKGLPYLVMDYISGKNLVTWCADEKPTLRQRLDLFLKICDAVAYAHRNLIVHRDLKPGNILVTDHHDPKLLDFGIAKLLEPDPDSIQTRSGMAMLTPEFASPEQLRGEPISTVTDVYALGTLLHLLLTGVNPNEGRQASNSDEHVIFGLGRRSVSRDYGIEAMPLDKDLEAILVKALRPEVKLRYVSVDALSDELTRYLGGHPVLARKGSFRYLALKFFQRHRLAVTAILCFGFGLLLTVGALLYKNDQLNREKSKVLAQQYRLERIQSFLVRLFMERPDSPDGRAESPQELFMRAMDAVHKDYEDDADVHADVVMALGNVYSGYGYSEDAQPHLLRALKTLEARDEPPFRSIASLHFYLGRLTALDNRPEKSLEHLEKAQALIEGQDDDLAEIVKQNISIIYVNMGRYDDAERLLRESLDLATKADKPGWMARSYMTLASVYRSRCQFQKALECFQNVVELNGKNMTPYEFANIYAALSSMTALQGRYEEAAEMALQGMSYLTEQSRYSHAASQLSSTLGRCYLELGRLDEAGPLLDRAVSLCDNALGDKQPRCGSMYSLLTDFYRLSGQFEKAEALAEENPYQYESRGLLILAIDRAKIALAKKDYRKVIAELDMPTPDLESKSTLSAMQEVTRLYMLGLALEGAELDEAANTAFAEAKQIHERFLKEPISLTARLWGRMADRYRDMGKLQKAEYFQKKAQNEWRHLLGENHPRVLERAPLTP